MPSAAEGKTVNKSSHKGFALPVTIFVLAMALVLITGGTFLARQELRIGAAYEYGTEAFYLAERGLAAVMVNWNVQAYSGLATWADTTVTDTLGSGVAQTRITRVGSRLYLLESTSTVTKGGAMLSGATRQAGMVVRLFMAEIEPQAAMTTRGSTTVGGNAEVHGEDEVPPGWGDYCPGPLENKPGIRIDDATDVATSGQGEVTGVPGVQEDITVADNTFTQFGDMDWDELTALADISLPSGSFSRLDPVEVGGVCATSVSTNWGDPLNPAGACGSYFPIIHIRGNGRIQTGGVGQGVLLVDGDLDLRGDFVFHGIIIVQGKFETQGNGNRIYGGVLAGNAGLEDQALVGGSIIQHSSCAVSRAVLNNSSLTRPRPLGERSWVDLSSVRQ